MISDKDKKHRDDLMADCAYILARMRERLLLMKHEEPDYQQLATMGELRRQFKETGDFLHGTPDEIPSLWYTPDHGAEDETGPAITGDLRVSVTEPNGLPHRVLRASPTTIPGGRAAQFMEHCPHCGKGLIVQVTVRDHLPGTVGRCDTCTREPRSRCDKCRCRVVTPTTCDECQS
jgi:hypothetical protein